MGELKLVEDEQSKGKEVNYNHKANPFLFVCALEVILRTLCKAGTYLVDIRKMTGRMRKRGDDHVG